MKYGDPIAVSTGFLVVLLIPLILAFIAGIRMLFERDILGFFFVGFYGLAAFAVFCEIMTDFY